MPKKQTGNKEMKERIVVTIYADEFEIVKDKLDIDEEITAKGIREALGLKASHRTAYTTELVKEIRDMTDDEKQNLLKKIKGEEE